MAKIYLKSINGADENARKAIYCTGQALEWTIIHNNLIKKFSEPLVINARKKVAIDRKEKGITLPISEEEYALRQSELYIKKACKAIREYDSQNHFLERKPDWESKEECIDLCKQFFNAVCELAKDSPRLFLK